jgi:hypothetical protein
MYLVPNTKKEEIFFANQITFRLLLWSQTQQCFAMLSDNLSGLPLCSGAQRGKNRTLKPSKFSKQSVYSEGRAL